MVLTYFTIYDFVNNSLLRVLCINTYLTYNIQFFLMNMYLLILDTNVQLRAIHFRYEYGLKSASNER